jgi:uncharacterized damage-inducible protein DinB
MQLRSALAILPVLALLDTAAWSQPPKSAPAASTFRQELLATLDGPARQAIALAEAMPEDKFAWRPMEGARSFGDVCLHIAGGNFLFLSYTGLKPPSGPAKDLAAVYMKRGFEMKELFAAEAAVKGKAQVIAILKQSLDQARAFVREVPEADLARPVQFFDQSTTVRGVLILMTTHIHEHLGQAIAYARMNRVVPPWSR